MSKKADFDYAVSEIPDVLRGTQLTVKRVAGELGIDKDVTLKALSKLIVDDIVLVFTLTKKGRFQVYALAEDFNHVKVNGSWRYERKVPQTGDPMTGVQQTGAGL